MKKMWVVLLLAALILSLCACSDDSATALVGKWDLFGTSNSVTFYEDGTGILVAEKDYDVSWEYNEEFDVYNITIIATEDTYTTTIVNSDGKEYIMLLERKFYRITW